MSFKNPRTFIIITPLIFCWLDESDTEEDSIAEGQEEEEEIEVITEKNEDEKNYAYPQRSVYQRSIVGQKSLA